MRYRVVFTVVESCIVEANSVEEAETLGRETVDDLQIETFEEVRLMRHGSRCQRRAGGECAGCS